LSHPRQTSKPRARAAREILINSLQPAIITQLGIEQRLQNDYLDNDTLSYPALYRYCVLLGALRATHLTNAANAFHLDTRSDFERKQGRYELMTIIERLGISTLVPPPVQSIAQAIKTL